MQGLLDQDTTHSSKVYYYMHAPKKVYNQDTWPAAVYKTTPEMRIYTPQDITHGPSYKEKCTKQLLLK